MKQILLLQLRPEDEVADDEYASIIAAGVNPDRVHRVRMEIEGVPELILDEYAAIIVGGGPSNVSDPHEKRSIHQRVFEPKLLKLLDEIVARDFPFLGICYGMGLLTIHQGGTVTKKHAEPVGAVDIIKTPYAHADHLFAELPDSFKAYVGHKEAVEQAPAHATLLATSELCPIQMYRIGNHVYGTQFHPELTHDSLSLRINAYKNMGYFHPDEADSLIEQARPHDVRHANIILERFVRKYS